MTSTPQFATAAVRARMKPLSRDELTSYLERLQKEGFLVEKQIQRSRATRGVPSAAPRQAAERAGSSCSRASPSPSPVHPDGESGFGVTVGERVSPVLEEPPLAAAKEGWLWHFAGYHETELVRHYFVVDRHGVQWYESEERARRPSPHKPLGRIAFSMVTTNSRGSVFRKAAVCWPLILPEDVPQVARDPSKTFFAVDYYVPQGFGAGLFGDGGGGVTAKKLVLAVSSPEERDEWVVFLRQYIDVFLAPRAESEELQYLAMPRHEGEEEGREGSGGSGAGAYTRRPLHRSEVISGEAPGGNYL